MQSFNELVEIISTSLPHVSHFKATEWANYLVQLEGCHLFSCASPEVDKDDWLRERRAGIGGSEIAAILGENHWNSPRQIWMSKVGMFDDKPAQQSEAARWGNLLETVVADEWAFRNNAQYVHIPVILQDDDRPYLLANIDGFTLSDDRKTITGILEVKTTSAYNNDQWENGPVPFHYMCQTNWYCGITRLKQYTIICLVGGQRLYAYELPADGTLFKREVEAADDFWNNHVITRVEPPATAVDKELIKKQEQENDLVQEDTPPAIFEDEETDRLVSSYIQLREKEKAIKDIKAAVYAQIKVAIGNSSQALTKSHTVVVKRSVRRTCDFDLLLKTAPEVYEAVVTSSASTSLDIK